MRSVGCATPSSAREDGLASARAPAGRVDLAFFSYVLLVQLSSPFHLVRSIGSRYLSMQCDSRLIHERCVEEGPTRRMRQVA